MSWRFGFLTTSLARSLPRLCKMKANKLILGFMVMGYGYHLFGMVHSNPIQFPSLLPCAVFQLLLYSSFSISLFSFFFSRSRKSAFLFISFAWALVFSHIYVCAMCTHIYIFFALMSLGFIRLFLHTSYLFLSISILCKTNEKYKKNKNNFKFNCLVVGAFFFSSGFFLWPSEILWSIAIYWRDYIFATHTHTHTDKTVCLYSHSNFWE